MRIAGGNLRFFTVCKYLDFNIQHMAASNKQKLQKMFANACVAILYRKIALGLVE